MPLSITGESGLSCFRPERHDALAKAKLSKPVLKASESSATNEASLTLHENDVESVLTVLPDL